jgi:hypothetical protein
MLGFRPDLNTKFHHLNKKRNMKIYFFLSLPFLLPTVQIPAVAGAPRPYRSSLETWPTAQARAANVAMHVTTPIVASARRMNIRPAMTII